MSKYEFYIDFEAISNPYLNRVIPNLSEFPFFYTIGAYDQDNHFKTKTSMLNFSDVTRANHLEKLKQLLIHDIRSLTKKEFEINNENVKFIGWNPHLENSITTKLFNIPTHALYKESQISLELITKGGNFSDDYFEYFKSLDLKDEMYTSVVRSGKTGVMASYSGFILYCYFKKKYYKKDELKKVVNVSKITSDLAYYNRDDVLKLHYIKQNWTTLEPKIKKLNKIRQKIINIQNEIIKLSDTKRRIIESEVDLQLNLNDYFNKMNPNELDIKSAINLLDKIIKLYQKWGYDYKYYSSAVANLTKKWTSIKVLKSFVDKKSEQQKIIDIVNGIDKQISKCRQSLKDLKANLLKIF
ncbi:hypothetical protein C4M97_02555 [Mycoplasmopsis pullorum]|uniref:hypothetical protein n=1 Tax=Mycoplasmopsis pullorum TaxID=48003 RepID=UPI001118C9DF|nr:hypothetical protein [Mycoplasmopsis pullorum]TNK81931.1 hypothetical protein C4M94_02550 [Mycoplasmopsis pullorum]TNK82787.1 hypothetical protein C4M80_02350 [Mycoplasmopsis pullorum]TNK84653.1 hypothetical protein C4M81_01660 [Mycoplasmopsis pullorum]TNK85387.1 hypothetical protein C4M92_01520 [Mycoplasmopsis pullorum]TNK85976.1 hypothetical protein C4M85_01795 [Mycoplasmopsis pullorum]